MSFQSSLNLNSGPAVSRRSQLAKVPLPPEFSTVCAWQKSNKKYEPSGYQIHHRQIPKLIECRAMEVAGVDASQEVREKLGPSVRTPEEVNKKMADLIAYVKELLMTSGDGRISVAPYDTSVVALIKDLEGDDAPEFPSCLEWIAENQMGDGSWGDEFFCIYDRLVNTLACVVALKSWNVHLDKIEKGVSYIRENVHKLKDGNIEHMTSGFEIVVPAMFERAKALGIQNLPYHHPSVKAIYAAKETRLSKY